MVSFELHWAWKRPSDADRVTDTKQISKTENESEEREHDDDS